MKRVLRLGPAALLLWPLAVGCDGLLMVDEGKEKAATWTGNAADCPSEAPVDQSVCTVAEGQFCAYWGKSGAQNTWASCACWEASSTERHWACEVAAGNFDCPAEQPADGALCGSHGGTCRYPPRTECNCLNETVTWKCNESELRDVPPFPSDLDPTRAVNALTDTERQSWCAWYVNAAKPAGSPEPPESALTPDGYTSNTGSLNGGKFQCFGCMPSIPVSYCVSNLALSTCAAPLSELTDCVSSIIVGCWPQPHGCARFHEKPGCTGTIVTPGITNDGQDAGAVCSIKVK